MATVFRIKLDGAQVVPGVDTPYTGIGIAIFDPKKGSLTYSINFKGLDFGSYIGQPSTPAAADDVTGLHLHDADRGANGPIVLDWVENGHFDVIAPGNRAWTVVGGWDKGDADNSVGHYASMLENAVSGEDLPLYGDIHTVGNPDGEIRGQFVTLSTEGRDVVKGTEGADTLPGLGGNDRIEGFRGADTLIGGNGNDKLQGGRGADIFLFADKLDGLKNVDRIVDFTGKDTIWLDASVFKAIPEGELKAKYFHDGGVPQDPDDHILLYGRKLVYDENGSGVGGATVFAKVSKGADIDAHDFIVV